MPLTFELSANQVNSRAETTKQREPSIFKITSSPAPGSFVTVLKLAAGRPAHHSAMRSINESGLLVELTFSGVESSASVPDNARVRGGRHIIRATARDTVRASR